MLVCPKCRKPLILKDRSFCCENRHSYDLAKSGYVNLVLGNTKTSGDSKEMVKARSEFLNHGYYQPLSLRLNELLLEYHVAALVDAGCGEGYYTQRFPVSSKFGFDLSKQALIEASKRDKRTRYAIASIFDLPVADDSVDAMVNIFAPIPFQEALRILRGKGILLVVSPAQKHLWGLKSVLYEHPYENELNEVDSLSMKKIHEEILSYPIHVEREHIIPLFMMTPYYWKSGKDALKKLEELNSLDTEAAFRIQIFQKQE